ncbi:unnamed protein product, partial [Adineta ricciae]
VTNPDSKNNPSTAQTKQLQLAKSSSKRPKAASGDDSFEREHRLAYSTNQYFDRGDSRSIANENQIGTVNGIVNSLLNEASCYGRYVPTTKKSTFLVFANSGQQFDYLMNRNVWPETLCKLGIQQSRYDSIPIIESVEIDRNWNRMESNGIAELPTKVPASYSIIALGIPTRWDISDFKINLRKQYPSIVKIERLYVRNGIPMPKVRIEFSSNEDTQQILKSKKLLLDDPGQQIRCWIRSDLTGSDHLTKSDRIPGNGIALESD